MRNRAKCKLCNSIVESLHSYDFVQCSCGEIFVDAGEGLRCGAKNWENFLRVDDEGNTIVPQIKDGVFRDAETLEADKIEYIPKTKKDYLDALTQMVTIYGELPREAQHQPVSNSDMHSILILLEHILGQE